MLWALVAAALFSIEAVIVKLAVVEVHILQVLFFRQLCVFAAATPQIVSTFPDSLKTNHPGIHALRLLGAFVALSAGFWALAVLPLTTAITLSFSKVFFVALLATAFLNESLDKHRLTAIVFGFLGVFLIMQPNTDNLNTFHVLIAIVGALGAAVAQSSVRYLAQSESTATLLIYQATILGIVAGIPLFWLWVKPIGLTLLYLLSIGVLATAGQWLAVKALRLGEASLVGSVQYLQLVYAAVLGYVIFAEIPDAYSIAGALIIIGSALYLMLRESAFSNARPVSRDKPT